MIIIIDNYDSFIYNIYQQISILYKKVVVFKNDQISIDEIKKLEPKAIIISPGPGRPENNGIILELINKLKGQCPILGVCLGMQAIGKVFGSDIVKANQIKHGKTSEIKCEKSKLFINIPNKFNVMRYHSLIIDKSSISKDLRIIAEDEKGEIMGIEHKKLPIFGVQFHPESISSEYGKNIFENFIKVVGG